MPCDQTLDAGKLSVIVSAATYQFRQQNALDLLAEKRASMRDSNLERFTERARSVVNGQLVRYSQRRSLIAVAAQNHISAFDANLIIAALQNRAEVAASIAEKSAAAERAPLRPYEETLLPESSWRATALLIAGVQFTIVMAAWWLTKGLW